MASVTAEEDRAVGEAELALLLEHHVDSLHGVDVTADFHDGHAVDDAELALFRSYAFSHFRTSSTLVSHT